MAYKVLIVDDSKLARMSIAKMLNTLQPGWARVEAANAEDALAQLAQHDADIALMDFNMPGRDGLDLASQLRDIKPDMPLALISANTQIEIVARARAIGAAFLAKPVTEQALAEFLAVSLQRLRPVSQ